MESLVTINHLSIKLNGQTFFDDFSFTFYKGVNMAVIGTGASGKTLLLKAILGTVPYTGIIKISGRIKVLFPKFSFSSTSVYNYFSYNHLLLDKQELICDFFPSSLEENPNYLTKADQCLLVFIKAILDEPNALFIDDLFSYLDRKTLKKIVQYCKKKKISLYFVTSNMEEVLYAKYLVVFHHFRVAMEGFIPAVFSLEKPLKHLGFSVPFLVDLSSSLKYYGIVDCLYLKKEDLLNQILKKKEVKGAKK